MYCVRIIYPRGDGRAFDWEHYFETHLPLGLRLLREHTGVVPRRVEVERDTAGPDGSAADYQCGCALYFDTRAQVDAMVGVFAIPEVAEQLAADWPRYTDVEPRLVISEVVDFPATA